MQLSAVGGGGLNRRITLKRTIRPVDKHRQGRALSPQHHCFTVWRGSCLAEQGLTLGTDIVQNQIPRAFREGIRPQRPPGTLQAEINGSLPMKSGLTVSTSVDLPIPGCYPSIGYTGGTSGIFPHKRTTHHVPGVQDGDQDQRIACRSILLGDRSRALSHTGIVG
jgi:hypothetical protein